CNVPPVFGRPRLCLELQASRGPDGLLPPARRPRARPRRVAPLPAGGLMVDRTSAEFRAALELYERATLLELGALADQTRWRLHPIHIHGFSPSEIDFFAGRFGMTLEAVIRELVAAGLDSVPGGGGEILVQDVRDRVAKKKAGADRWLEVMETAHRLGLKTSVTMMYGLREPAADRIEHLF